MDRGREPHRARACAALGVGRGDRVATLLENSPEQVVSFFAAAFKLGAIQVPINTAYKGEFLRHVLADSGARVVVVQGSLADRVAEVCAATRRRATCPSCGRSSSSAPTDAVITGVPVVDWEALLAAGVATRRRPTPAVGPADLACFIYTAGTTGPVEGLHAPAPLRGRARRADRPGVAAAPPTTSCSRRCRCSTSTRSRCAWSARCSSAGSAAIVRKFSVSRFWPEVRRTDATMLSMLGSLAILVANAEDHPEQAGHRLRLCAAAPMPPDTDRIWRERFGCATFSGGYGLTEASLISMLPAGEAEQGRRRGQAERRTSSRSGIVDDERPTRSRSARSARSCAGPPART